MSKLHTIDWFFMENVETGVFYAFFERRYNSKRLGQPANSAHNVHKDLDARIAAVYCLRSINS
jgi:hypothetical protein